MSQHQIWLNVIIAINLGLVFGFLIRCYRDKEFRKLAKKMYKMIK